MFGKRKRRTTNGTLEMGKEIASSHPSGQHGPQSPSSKLGAVNVNDLRTLQRYHAAPGDPRTRFMEKHSTLSRKKLAVACEQVSMFITHDNTIISFFEMSAKDIEAPIIRRLQTNDTIIRQYGLP